MTNEEGEHTLGLIQRQRRENTDRTEELTRRETFNARFFSDNLRNAQVAAMPSILIPGLLIDIFCFAYPAFYSLKSIKNNNATEIIQWMCYWIISTFFMVMERNIYFLTLIPFYIIFRRALCIWCLLPIPNNGGTVIYSNIFRRLLNNETPSNVFRDVSRQLSLETLQRKAIELKKTVIDRMRAAQPANLTAAGNLTAAALQTMRQSTESSPGSSN